MKNWVCLLLLVGVLSCDDDGEFSLPATPYSIKAVRMSETSAVISWKDTTTAGGNYRILRAVNTSPYEQLTTVPQGTLSYTDNAITAEATYSYQMTLVDERGNSSEYSAVATVNALQNSQMSSFTVPDKNVGDSPFAITAPTTLNPSPITYTSSNEQVAKIGGNVITIMGAGTAIITASQPMSFGYTSASSTANFTVHP
ncbi:MAG: hypothetical protein QM762_28455 [Chryseolinea sp.]